MGVPTDTRRPSFVAACLCIGLMLAALGGTGMAAASPGTYSTVALLASAGSTYTLTTTVVDPADGTLTPETGPQDAGSVVPLTATPNPGYSVKAWTGADVEPSTDTINTVTMTGDQTVSVEFQAIFYTVTLGSGIATIEAPPYTYGEVVHLIATVPSCQQVTGWTGTDDDASTASANAVTVTGDTSVSVSFATIYYALNLSVVGTGGTVAATEPPPYACGQVVNLIASADAGYTVKAWSGADIEPSTATTNTVTMNGNTSVTVEFEPQPEGILSVNVESGTPEVLAGTPITGVVDITLVNDLNPAATHTVVLGLRDMVTGAFVAGTTPVVVLDVVPPAPGPQLYAGVAVQLDTLPSATTEDYTVSAFDAVNAASPEAAIAAFEAASPVTDDAYNLNVGSITADASYKLTTAVVGGVGGTLTPATSFQAAGAVVDLVATADACYQVAGWLGTDNDALTTSTNTVEMTSDKTVVVDFALSTYALTLEGPVVATESAPYLCGEVVHLTATAAAGYQVTAWTGADVEPSTALTNTVTMTGDETVSVEVAPILYTLTLSAGVAATEPPPYTYGEVVHLTALVPACQQVTGWTGTDNDASTASMNTVTVTANMSVSVSFAPIIYALTLGAGITATESAPYVCGETVHLTATPPACEQVTGWTGVDSSSGNSAIVVMTSDKAVSVAFALIPYTLTLTPPANGTLAALESAPYTCGETVHLIATAAIGYHVQSWTGADVEPSSATTNTVTMSSDKVVSVTLAVNTYTLNYTAGANGSITGAASQTVNYGGSGTAVTAVASTGYYFVNWSDSTTENPRTDTNATSNISVTANFAINTYTLTYTAGANGSISGASSQTVNYGGSGTAVTAVANTGYYFMNWSDSATANPRTDTNVTANIAVTAVFAASPVLTLTPPVNGTLAAVEAPPYAMGQVVHLTATPASCYQIASWTGADTEPSTATTNTVTMNGNKTVSVTFALIPYTLTLAPPANGTLTAQEAPPYTCGETVHLIATAATGYHVQSWTGADVEPSTSSTNTVTMTSDKVVSVAFAVNTYTLTYTAGANGSISGTASQTVNYGGSGTAVTAVPSTGYYFVNWSDSKTANPRTDTNVTANIAVTANFAINTFTLAYTAGANGSISGAASQTVNYGGSGTAVTAVASTGYHFVNWSDAKTANPRTDTNVTANIAVTATFAINTYTLTYSAGANGSISGTASQTVNYGGSGTAVTAVPNSGYHFVNWSDLKTANPRTDTNVTANVAVTANFAANPVLTLIPAVNGTLAAVQPPPYSVGQVVQLTATAAACYQVASWTGADTEPSTATTNTVTMNGDETVSVTFAQITYALMLGPGIVATEPAPYACGEVVHLTATPPACEQVTGWTGVDASSGTTATVVMNSDKAVSVSFGVSTYSLSLGSGVVATESAPYTCGEVVHLTATVPACQKIIGWTGTDNDASTAATNTVTMNSDKAVSVALAPITYVLTLGPGVTATESAPYTCGELVHLTATVPPCEQLTAWTGVDTSSGNTATVLMTSDKAVSVTFQKIEYALDLSVNNGNGTLTASNPAPYDCGDVVNLTATPDAGYRVKAWSGADVEPSVATTNTVTMNSDKSVSVEFEQAEGIDGLNVESGTPEVLAGQPVTGVIDVDLLNELNPNSTHTVVIGLRDVTTGAWIEGLAPQVLLDEVTPPATAQYTGLSVSLVTLPVVAQQMYTVSLFDAVNVADDAAAIAAFEAESPTADDAYNINGGPVTVDPSHLLTMTVGANGTVDVATGYQAVDSTVTMTATPDPCYQTVWSSNVTVNPSDANQAMIVMSADETVTVTFQLVDFTLTYAADANGSIVGETPQTVPCGASGTAVTAVANTGYSFVQWSDGVTTAARTDTNVTADLAVTASFAINTFTLAYSAGAGGSIIGATSQTVTYGDSGSAVTAVANAGYSFVAWNDGVTSATRTDTNVTASIAVTASFAVNTYTLTYTAGENGSISGTASQTVNYGGSGTTVTAVANAGYSFVAWSDGVMTAARTDSNVTANISVTATFAINTYTLMYTAGTGGAISGTASQTVNYGGSGTAVTAVANAGYSFVAWNDGVTSATRTDTNVTANISVTATFAINTYTLTYTAGTGGSISGAASQTVNYGGSGSAVTAVANAGYSFVKWSDNLTTATRTDTNVTANISVTATFAINTYTLTYTAGTGGSISGAASQTVNYGGSGTAVTAVANTGYSFVQWSDNLTTATRTDTNVTANISVTATFASSTYTLTTSVVGDHGTLTPATGPQPAGSMVTLTATPASGYMVKAWTGTDNDSSTANTNTVTMTGNKTVTVTFQQYYTLTTSVPGDHGTLAPATGPQPAGSVVTLTATPAAGYMVKSWSGTNNDRSTATTNTVTMTKNKSVSVTFTQIMYTLTTSVPGDHGTLKPATGQQPANSVVTLTATPSSGYMVKAWTGTDNDASTATTNTVTMTGNKTVTVTFTQIMYTLTTSVVGGNGTLVPATGPQPANSVVTLTATPASGYKVKSWSGTNNNSSTLNTNSVTMTGNKTVTVTFTQITYTLTTKVSGGHGTLAPATGPQVANSVVTLTATPASGYKVKSWSGTNNDSSTSNTNTVTMTGNKTVTVTFKTATKSLTAPLVETALPASGEVTADAPVYLRLTAGSAIYTASVCASVDGVSVTADWVAISATDGWAMIAPQGAWPVGKVITVTASASTESGVVIEPVVSEFSVVTADQVAAQDAAVIPQPSYSTLDTTGLDLEQEGNNVVTVSVMTDTAIPTASGAVGPIVAIAPQQAFATPQRVWLPVPAGVVLSELQVNYYHVGENAAWYPAESIEGWLVPDSDLQVTMNGTTYLGFVVRYAGIVQLTVPTP